MLKITTKILLSSLFFYIFDSFIKLSKNKDFIKNSIIIVKLDNVGDFIIFMDLAIKLRKKYEKYKIILYTTEICSELAINTNIFDEVITVLPQKMTHNLIYRFSILKNIYNRSALKIIQPVFSRVFLTGDSLVRASSAKEKYGFLGDYSRSIYFQKKISNLWYSNLIKTTNFEINEIVRQNKLGEIIGIETNKSTPYEMLPIVSDLKKFRISNYIVIFPGSSWAGRCWPINRFIELIKEILLISNVNIVLCGSILEVDICNIISQDINNERLKNLSGITTLSELVEIIRGANFVISNETSAIHISASVGVESICILGGGHFNRFVPYPENVNIKYKPIAVYKNSKCFNCNWSCTVNPSNSLTMPCILDISIDSVLYEVNKKLLND